MLGTDPLPAAQAAAAEAQAGSQNTPQPSFAADMQAGPFTRQACSSCRNSHQRLQKLRLNPAGRGPQASDCGC